jgi:hypothetical protein
MFDWTKGYSDTQTQHSILSMLVIGIPGLSRQVRRTTRVLPSCRKRSRPEHDMTEEIMTLAYYMRSDATVLIDLSEYALQYQSLN